MAENISIKMEEALCDGKLKKENVHIVVTDNDANLAKRIRAIGLKNEPCFIYTMQLVINYCIFS